MFLRRACWAAAGLLTMLPLGSALAQDGSAPPIPTLSVPFADADSEAVTLVYKYRAGQAEQARLILKGERNITFLGAPGRAGSTLPAQVFGTSDLTMRFASRVVGVDANGGSIRVALTGFQSTTNIRDLEVATRLQNGKLVVSRNGVRQPENHPSRTATRQMIASYPRVLYVTNRGVASLSKKLLGASQAKRMISNNRSGGSFPISSFQSAR